MANIVLTGKCDLKCPYCFADEFIKEKSESISVDAFLKALDFSVPDGAVGLIGGEPLIYENIDTVLDILKHDSRFYRVMIYTNGISIDKHIDKLTDRKNHLLINLNSPDVIGKARFDRIISNIDALSERGMRENITLGINVYEENQDFTYFCNTLRDFFFKKARISVAIPRDKSEGALNYFTRMKPTLLKLYAQLKEIGVAPCYDCNAVPKCIFTEDELEFIKTLPYVSEMERELLLGERSVCAPIVDIYPDLTAKRCFGCFDYSVPIKNFKSINDLKNHFFLAIDSKKVHTLSCNTCADCYKHNTFSCFGGCLCYK